MSVDSINQEPAVVANTLVNIILSEDDATRNQALDTICESCSLDQLLAHIEALDSFWRSTENLYHRVRALFFLSAIHRYHCLLYTSPSPRDQRGSRMPSSA